MIYDKQYSHRLQFPCIYYAFIKNDTLALRDNNLLTDNNYFVLFKVQQCTVLISLIVKFSMLSFKQTFTSSCFLNQEVVSYGINSSISSNRKITWKFLSFKKHWEPVSVIWPYLIKWNVCCLNPQWSHLRRFLYGAGKLVCCKHMDFQNLWIPYKLKVQQSCLF